MTKIKYNDSCFLLNQDQTNIKGQTENIHIISIVGRFLEHSRIYCFGEGEDMTIYIASGDFLTRNTERRVEVGVRVDDREIAKKLRGILDLQLRDTVNAREMQPDGIYTRVKPKQGEPPVDSQMAMYGYFQHGFETAHPAAPTRKAAPRPIPTNRKIGVSAVFLTACLATKSNPRKGCSAPFPPDGRDAASAPE